MPIAAIEVYMERLPTVIAQYKLAMADAVSVPHMKDSDRRKTLRSWTSVSQKYAQARVAPRGALKLMGIAIKSV